MCKQRSLSLLSAVVRSLFLPTIGTSASYRHDNESQLLPTVFSKGQQIHSHNMKCVTWCSVSLLGAKRRKRNSHRNSQKDATVNQNLLFHVYTSATCLGGKTAHHQEPKTALASSGFAYVKGCWTCSCWTLSASNNCTASNLPRMQNQRLLVQF